MLQRRPHDLVTFNRRLTMQMMIECKLHGTFRSHRFGFGFTATASQKVLERLALFRRQPGTPFGSQLIDEDAGLFFLTGSHSQLPLGGRILDSVFAGKLLDLLSAAAELLNRLPADAPNLPARFHSSALGELHSLRLGAESGDLLWSSGVRVWPSEVYDRWKTANVTVVDELGTRALTDAMYDTLKRAIDDREGKPAVYISNKSIDQLHAVYDDRIASRLAAGTVIRMTGDRRIR